MIKQGFILVEVLIALVISSMLTGVLFLTISQISVGVRSVDNVMSVHTRALIAIRQLERDIAGAMLLQEKITKNFFSQVKDDNSQLLTFITNNPLQQWQGSSVTPRLVRVTYRLVADKTVSKNKQKQYILTRQESTDLTFEPKTKTADDNDTKKKARVYEMIDGIASFKTFYVAGDEDDIAAWDSDSKLDDGKKREHNQMLPELVTLELELADSMQIKHMFKFDIPIQPDMVPYKIQSAAAADTVKTPTQAQPAI